MSLLSGLRARGRFLFSLSKGIRRGDLFPRSGRAPLGSAPGGSRSGPTRWGNQVAAFVETEHRLPVSGLSRSVQVLHLTDLHVRGEGPWLDALCAALRSVTPPDLLVLTGEVVATGWTEPAV